MAEISAVGNFAVTPPSPNATGISGSPTNSPVPGISAKGATGRVEALGGTVTNLLNRLGSGFTKHISDLTKFGTALKNAHGFVDLLTKKINTLGSASKSAALVKTSSYDTYGTGNNGKALEVGSNVFRYIKSSKDISVPPTGTGGSGDGSGGGQRALPTGGETGGWFPPSNGGGGWGGRGGGGGRIPPSGGGRGGGPGSGDSSGAGAFGAGALGAVNNFVDAITGKQGIGGLLMAGLTGMGGLWGALSGGSLQYTYNRINGPAGNQNQMLQLAGALGAQSGMTGISLPNMVQGLAQRNPVMGTQEDMLSTILAGQSVGALLKGTPNRSGFFEAVRQMQLLTPGADPGQMAGTLAGYMQNTRSQQMGMYLGEGAFTMVGKGGRFKSLAEWADGITKFMEQHRIGNQGQSFTKDELLAQNFPGSNINAWFQMLGVPQDMVDYWWNYVLTNAGQISPVSAGAAKQTAQLQQNVQGVRGIDLSYERLRNVTQGTRRDYLMGNKMYGMYAARESADRRFNVGMQQTDAALANMLSTTNVGAIMSLLPTPVMEMVMPLLTGLVTSPLGGMVTGGMGSVFDAAKGALFGDVPIGDASVYGDAGATNTAHLSPSLAKRVNAMLAANPRLKISSGYRDTVTQNRLYRNGVGRVGPASTSAHTRGWAVDIGPKSEGGWLAANAGKFGLQSAANKGEPWHIQLANTMTVGDPGSLGPNSPIGEDWNFNPINNMKNVLSFGAKLGMGAFGDLIKMMQSFVQGLAEPVLDSLRTALGSLIEGGGLSKLIDKATGVFSKLITGPMERITGLLGPSSITPDNLTGIINQSYSGTIPVAAFKGFQSYGSGGDQVFGDPASSLMTGGGTTVNANMGSPIVFNATITINGMGNSQADAKRAAAALVDHLQTEVNKKKWLVS